MSSKEKNSKQLPFHNKVGLLIRTYFIGMMLGIAVYRELLRRYSNEIPALSIDSLTVDICLGICTIIIMFGASFSKMVTKLSVSMLFFIAGIVGLIIGFLILYEISP